MDLIDKSHSIGVYESSAAGEARRIATRLCEALSFPPIKSCEVAIIVTELANNLWRHGGGGDIILRPIQSTGQVKTTSPVFGLEILAIDKGPGMANIERCMRDGYTTGGSTGIGLGAVARLSSYSEIYTLSGQGTVSLSRIWANPLPKKFFPTIETGAICLPIREERHCGDAWAEKFSEAGHQIILVDGLGHGVGAAKAAETALKTFLEKNLSGKEMINALHLALKETVGAVVGLIEIKPLAQKMSFMGVGNIEGKIFNGETRKALLSHNGTLGHSLQSIRQWDFDWKPHTLLIFHSDGISTKWDLANYPGLSTRDTAIIAGVIYRDFRRERDDASVIVMRQPS